MGYSLSADAASGFVIYTRTGGVSDPASPHQHALAAADLAPENHTVNTGLTLVNGTIYSITISVTNAASRNGTATIAGVMFETTIMTLDYPVMNSYLNTATVSYTLFQNISDGDIVATRTGGASDPQTTYRYSLSGAELAAGSHTVNTGVDLTNAAVYTFFANRVSDAGGYATLAGTGIDNVTFDNRSVGLMSATPALKSIMTSAAR